MSIGRLAPAAAAATDGAEVATDVTTEVVPKTVPATVPDAVAVVPPAGALDPAAANSAAERPETMER
jgi:hypothetical protein